MLLPRLTSALLLGCALGAVALTCNLAVGRPAAAHPAGFTIDQVMQTPYPSGLTASQRTGSVAWVFDARGVRNVWVAGAAQGGQPRQVTAFDIDGFDIGQLAWSPDAHAIAFTRAQSLEDDLPANVVDSPAGVLPREVWVVPTTGGAARRLGAGHTPSFSPDGTRLVFADKKQIFLAPADGSAAPQALVSDEGVIAGMAWSPDGRRLAFVSARGSHALIGVYDFAAHSLTWMTPSLDHDGAPVFSPDGSRVAFIRLPSQKHPEFISRRAGEPWSIWVADPVTGSGRRVWVADRGQGSMFQPTLSEQNLLWAAHDQLVFPWEKTGWLQLYAVPAQGGSAHALTSGDFEIAALGLSADQSRVVFASNQDDIDRMHVWTVDPERGGATPVAQDKAVTTYPAASADGTVYALQSDATRPLQPVVLERGRWRLLTPQLISPSFPAAKLIAPQSLTFTAKDGHLVHAQIFLPRDGAATHPAMLFFHGGPRRQMLLGFHPMGAYNWMYSENEYFAAKGYVVLSVNYRGGIGYGLDYREAENFGPGGGSELNDLLGAVAYLKGRQDVDSRRLGIWGASYGGLMTALGLSRDSKDITAGVDYAGLYNWDTFLESIDAPTDGPEAARIAVASSPVATIDQWKSPVLIVQADDDRNVPSRQASELILDLREHAIPHDEIMIPNEIHDLARYGSWLELFDAADAYFDRHLMELPAGK